MTATSETNIPDPVRIALPKGRMFEGVSKLLADAGIKVKPTARGYRPQISLPGFEAKMLKPQNIITMLAAGAGTARSLAPTGSRSSVMRSTSATSSPSN